MTNHIDSFRIAVQAALGVAPEQVVPGRFQRFSTNGKPSDTSGWCQLFEGANAGVFGDFRAGVSTLWTAHRRELMTPAQRADLRKRAALAQAQRQSVQQAAWSEAATRLALLWKSCEPLTADGGGRDPVSLYLRRRLALQSGRRLVIPAVLRLHRDLPYYVDRKLVARWPAMVASMQNVAGAQVALHRTWLTPDGFKAPVPGGGTVKKLSPACGPVVGACVRLCWLDADAADLAGSVACTLGVAEGIETALAARCGSGVPTVAAYSAGALAAWQWPHGLRRLVIFGDADAAGIDAADLLLKRARHAGLAAVRLIPSRLGADRCDVWAERGLAATNEASE